MNSRRQDDREFIRLSARPGYETGHGEITLVDLFSGCGGMTLGMAHAAHLSGFAVRVPLALDNDPDALGVFRHNFHEAACVLGNVCNWFDGALEARLTDVERITRVRVGTGIDVLLGGPPCQGHSDLNNHTRRNDPRNNLYARMARAARVLEARLVVVENVPAVLHDQGRVVEATKDALQRDGYEVADLVLDLWEIGVPQRRKRHLLLGSRDATIGPQDIVQALQNDVEHMRRDVRWAIDDLVNTPVESKFEKPPTPSKANVRRIEWLFEQDEYDLPNALRPPCHQNGSHTYKSIYGRLRWDRPAQTITTGYGSMGQGRYVHPARRRTITPHEAARLQSFPDFFAFEATHKRSAWARLIGNAVPPLLTMRIGEHAFKSAYTSGYSEADIASQPELAAD